ncbi:sulfotransferase [Roseibium sp. Sym1]|uniref:sulfotransferase n=1 Tax=Roseibium sp. Sym1 TaxID=3016006 RepID=UPI0022B504C0|nr:sulfotransferase [Roseibium sp. Sym1]
MTANPILVSSPTPRSGTTLVQRLITSSDNGICYGEFCGRRIVELCEFAHKELVAVQNNRERQEYEWDNIFQGNHDYWMVGLDLPGEFPGHALVGAVQFYKQNYDEATRAIDKEIWAAKVPKIAFRDVVKTSDLISDLKCIYIYRNIYDVIKSQKTRGWFERESDLVKACEEWLANTEVIAALKRAAFQNQPTMLHVVQYEDLTENLQDNIEQIEAFTGLSGIKPEVADTKVNTWKPTSRENLEPRVSYEAPQGLARHECELIDKICGERMRELYPELSMEDFLPKN